MDDKNLTVTPKKLWKNENFQTVLTIVLIVVIIFGFWYGSEVALNTKNPLLVVVSGSMDTISDGQTEGYTHPFAHTLQIGDLIVIQGVSPSSLNASYPNSDIIVFHKPTDYSELIVHRIVAEEKQPNGTIFFRTKGDGNPVDKWPSDIQSYEYDPWGWVSQDLVVGKVVMRVPLVGYVDLFMRNNSLGVPIIVILIVLLVIVEFVGPLFRGKKETRVEQKSGQREETSGNSD